MVSQFQRTFWILAFSGFGAAILAACRPSSSVAQKPGAQDPKAPVATVKNAGLARKLPPAQAKRGPQGLDVQALTEQWSQRRALSCKIQLKVSQAVGAGATTRREGTLAGRVAWSRGSDGSQRLRVQLQGTLGEAPCRVRATSMGEGILLERWNPALHYAITRRLPAQTLTIESMTQLAVPMVVSVLQQGCTPLLAMPPAASLWSPTQSGPAFVSWSTSQGATQTLWVEPNKLPRRREMHFKDAQGQKVSWALSTQCQSA